MANPFVHMELNTPDLAKAKEFYGQLCGWSFNDTQSPAGIYSLFKPTDGPGGGIFSMPGAPTAWLPYIGVEDIDAATDKAIALGATLLHRADVPGMGSFSVFTDPTGANIALWQQKS
jgi:predicted enzyme related to lactoylglutathione lyase